MTATKRKTRLPFVPGRRVQAEQHGQDMHSSAYSLPQDAPCVKLSPDVHYEWVDTKPSSDPDQFWEFGISDPTKRARYLRALRDAGLHVWEDGNTLCGHPNEGLDATQIMARHGDHFCLQVLQAMLKDGHIQAVKQEKFSKTVNVVSIGQAAQKGQGCER